MQCLWSRKNCEWHDVPTSIAWEDPLFIHGKCGVQALQKVASRRTAPRLRENTKKTHLDQTPPQNIPRQPICKTPAALRDFTSTTKLWAIFTKITQHNCAFPDDNKAYRRRSWAILDQSDQFEAEFRVAGKYDYMWWTKVASLSISHFSSRNSKWSWGQIDHVCCEHPSGRQKLTPLETPLRNMSCE